MPAGTLIKVEERKPTPYERYKANHPEFREEHRAYMKERANCKICGQSVRRYNMSHHKKTTKCSGIVKTTKYEQTMNLLDRIEELMERTKEDEATKKQIQELKDNIIKGA